MPLIPVSNKKANYFGLDTGIDTSIKGFFVIKNPVNAHLVRVFCNKKLGRMI